MPLPPVTPDPRSLAIRATRPQSTRGHHAWQAEDSGFAVLQVQELLAQIFSGVTHSLQDETENASVVNATLNSIPAFALTSRAKEPCVICREQMLPADWCR